MNTRLICVALVMCILSQVVVSMPQVNGDYRSEESEIDFPQDMPEDAVQYEAEKSKTNSYPFPEFPELQPNF